MKGFTGKILRVNLSSSTCITKDLDEKIARDYPEERSFMYRDII